MRLLSVTVALFLTTTASSYADEYTDMAQFAQSICGDIPEGSLTRSEIAGKVEANAALLTKILGGSANADAKRIEETYKGIPFDKLPANIPTVSMCKSELIKVLIARKKKVANRCRKPEFGQEGWNRSEQYSDSSGREDGGRDQNWWCNRVAASFISSRTIGSQNHWQKIASSEESDKDWKGHVTYKYHCTIKVDWDPLYFERQDWACGSHEE